MDQRSPDDAPGTLGGLLFQSPSTIVPELEWTALVRGIAAGNQTALRDLYDRSHRIAFTLIMRIVKDRQTAEEVTLDVYHEIWKRAPDYDAANGSVLGWILNQARSRAIDQLRHDQRRKRVNPHPKEPAIPLDADAHSEALSDEETGRRLRAAVAALDKDERMAIEAAFFFEMTHGEIANRFNEPLGTVKSRIRNGLRKLRKRLAGDEEEQ